MIFPGFEGAFSNSMTFPGFQCFPYNSEPCRTTMMISIETLSKDNEVYVKELKRANYQLMEVRNRIGFNIELRSSNDVYLNGAQPSAERTYIKSPKTFADARNAPEACGPQVCHRHRVLVYGDESARGLSAGISELLDPSEVNVQGIISSGCTLRHLADSIFQPTCELGMLDTVIVCLNLEVTAGVSRHLLDRLCAVGKYTNLVFCLTCSPSSSFQHDKCIKFIYSFLHRNSASVRIFDNNIVNNKFRLTRRLLCRNLANYVLCSQVLKKRVLLRSNFCVLNSAHGNQRPLLVNHRADCKEVVSHDCEDNSHFLV